MDGRIGVSMTAAVAIICKAPIVGRSKTRMIPIMGAEAAARLAGAFLSDVSEVILRACERYALEGVAVYAPKGAEPALRAYLPPDFRLMCRQDENLGQVLYSASQQLFAEGHTQVILVNADSPTLPPSRLTDALALLEADGDRLVLGPAIDGGYYLIGLKRPVREVFIDIPWSTSETLARTRDRARDIGLPIVELAPWYDVDDAETLALLSRELSGMAPNFALPTDPQPVAAATRGLLAEITRSGT